MPEERVFNLTVEEGGKRVDTYVADALCALSEDEKADDRAGDFGFGDDDDFEDQEEFELSGDAAAGTAYNAYAYRTFSRSSVKKLIDGGNVTVNGKSCKANLKLKTGDNVTVTVPEPEKTPGPDDLSGCSDKLYYPKSESYLSSYESMVVRPSSGDTVYLQYKPEKIQYTTDAIMKLKANTVVTALAKENGYTLVLVQEGVAGWIRTFELDVH